jgi:hypothetical protein
MSLTLQQSHTISIRRYEHESDKSDVEDICRNVYGGTDYLPRLIQAYSSDPSFLLLSCVANDTVVGVIGCHLKGEMIFIFGLRVREDQRGKGVAKLLASELITQSRLAFGSRASCVLTVTIPENKAAISIFSKLLQGSPKPRHVCLSWPPSDARMQYEQDIGWPDNRADKDQDMLDHWPHVKDLLLADQEAVASLEKWRIVEDKEALMGTIQSIYSSSSREFEPELDGWLPGMYETLPVSCQEVDLALKDQRVWQLEKRAALIVYTSREARMRTIVGIMAEGSCEVNSALLFVHQKLSGFHHYMSFIHIPSVDVDVTAPLAISRCFESKPEGGPGSGKFISFGAKIKT